MKNKRKKENSWREEGTEHMKRLVFLVIKGGKPYAQNGLNLPISGSLKLQMVTAEQKQNPQKKQYWGLMTRHLRMQRSASFLGIEFPKEMNS